MKEIISLAKSFMENDSFGDKTKEVFSFVDRGSNLILSAPHSTKSYREKEVKQADAYTGAICLFLGKKHNLSTVVRNNIGSFEDDIFQFVLDNKLENKFFLDIHGIARNRDFEIAIGTGGIDACAYRDVVDKINDLSAKLNLTTVLNHPDYRGVKGLTYKLQQQTSKASALQIELRKDLRDFYNTSEIFQNKTLVFMDELIECLIDKWT
ncbi:MAG: hypothetical protein R3Y43_02995 [Alphaproteobacteria bacterium]